MMKESGYVFKIENLNMDMMRSRAAKEIEGWSGPSYKWFEDQVTSELQIIKDATKYGTDAQTITCYVQKPKGTE